jgi:ABC-2 type transport system permease protein
MTYALDAPTPPKRPRLGLSVRGIATVAVHEFRLRIRAGRWRWLLVAWIGSLLLFTALLRAALIRGGQANPGTDMYGGLLLVMLGLALLLVPALTAQSINGDRERGVLAILQTTLLTPAEIALGKLVAAWGTAMVFIVAVVPLAMWCVFEGASGERVIVSLTVAAILLGVVCAIAQCLSALLTRSTTSALMSYLTVFALTVGTVVAFGLALALTQTTDSRVEGGTVVERTETHADKVWWLLAPNPFVVVADAAPRVRQDKSDSALRLDTLGAIGEAVRSMRESPTVTADGEILRNSEAAVWPYGLAANVMIGLGAVVLTARRLATPSARLPRAVRVA